MILERKAAILGDAVLAPLDFRIMELFYPTALKADQMVVVLAFIELVDRLARLEIVALENAGLLELQQYPVDRRQANVLMLGQQFTVDILGTHVPMPALLKNLEHLQPGQGGLEPHVLEFTGCGHVHAPGIRPDGSRAGQTGENLPIAYHNGSPTVYSVCQSMPLPRSISLVLAVAAVLSAIAGCSSTDPNRSGFFEPYRIEVPQGNYVDQIMLDQVKVGMTREQVKFALGTPLMIDAFHPDRWDYVFRFQHRNLSAELRRATVVFVDGKVSDIVAVGLPQFDKGNDPALPGYRRTQGRFR